jgi:DNA modification methylase
MSYQLYYGDCLEILPQMQANSVDAVIADPPYTIGTASNRKSANKPMGWADINNASFWFSAWYAEVWRILKPSGCFWTFCSWRTLPVVQCAVSRIGGMSITSAIVWDKDWIGVGSTKGLREQFEMIALIGKPDFSIEDRAISNIWTIPWNSQRPSGHPSEKPEAIIDRILDVSNITGIVVDPFAGSGTAGVCAVRRNCEYIGIELETMWTEYATGRIGKSLSNNRLQATRKGGRECSVAFQGALFAPAFSRS